MENEIFIKAENDDELEQVIKNNINRAYQIRKELKLLDKATVSVTSNINNSILQQEEDSNNELEEETEEEYLYYYLNLIEDLKNITIQEERIQVVLADLPTSENKNYSKIINRIKIEILKEIYELETLKQEESESDFVEEVDKEQNDKREILKLIEYIQAEKQEEIIEQASSVSNKLVFLTTNLGTIYLASDLSGKEEYFASFKELLLSIENGTFQNVERFRNNSNFDRICEVKGFKTRIIFDRLNKDTYVILGGFITKADKSKSYSNMLENRINYYRNNKNSILARVDNSDYLNQNQQVRDSIIRGLSEKNLVKINKKGVNFSDE